MISRFRTHVAYAIGGVANGLALFVLIPYLVLRFSPAEYGLWNLFEISILFITMLAGAGIDVGLIRSYWGEEAEPPRPLVGTVIIGAALWGLLIGTAGAALYGLLAPFDVIATYMPGSVPPGTLLLVLFTGVVEGWFNLLVAVLRVREQAFAFAAITFGRMLLFLLLAIVAVENGGGIYGALSGRFIAAIAGTTLTLLLLLPHFDWKWRRVIWRRVVRYGLPLLPTNLASYALFAADRYVLAAFTTAQVVGVYSFMFKLATTLDILLIRPFYLDWNQRRFMVATRPDARERFGTIAVFVFWATTAFGLLIFAGTRALYTWVDEPVYLLGIPYVPLILLGFIAYGLSYPLNVGMILKDRTDWLPPLSWLAAAVNIGLNLWWVPAYGMAGAAWANVLSLSLYTLLFAVASQRLYPIHYPWEDIAKVTLASALAGAGVYAIDALMPNFPWLGTAIKVAWVALPMLTVGYTLFGNVFTRKTVADEIIVPSAPSSSRTH